MMMMMMMMMIAEMMIPTMNVKDCLSCDDVVIADDLNIIVDLKMQK